VQHSLQEDLNYQAAQEIDGEASHLISQLRKQVTFKDQELKDLQERADYDKTKLRELERELLETKLTYPAAGRDNGDLRCFSKQES
jgi:hypothetical protein